MTEGPRHPEAWPVTLARWVAPAEGNSAARRGLQLSFWAMVGLLACGLGGLLAMVGLVFSLLGLARSTVVGGRAGALRGLALNGLALAVSIFDLYLVTSR
jgi:hypothetical protein